MQTLSKILLLLMLLAATVPAQGVEITAGGKSKKVKTVKKSKITYFSLNDFASKFSLKLTRTAENTKFELTTYSKSSVKFTAKNPNAIVTKEKKSKTYKMARSAIKQGNDLLVPLVASKDALSSAFDGKYSYKIPKEDATAKEDKGGKKDDKETNAGGKDTKPGKQSVITKANYDQKANGLICRFTYTGEAAKIQHSIKNENGKYISLTIENCDITLKNVNKSFSSGPVKEVKGRVRKGNGELMIYLNSSYSSYEVKRIKSKKELQVLIYSVSESSADPVKKRRMAL